MATLYANHNGFYNGLRKCVFCYSFINDLKVCKHFDLSNKLSLMNIKISIEIRFYKNFDY